MKSTELFVAGCATIATGLLVLRARRRAAAAKAAAPLEAAPPAAAPVEKWEKITCRLPARMAKDEKQQARCRH